METHRQPIRVLIVDDHSVVRSGLSAFLTVLDDLVCVGEAATGAEAIHLCERARPDVVLMDVEMPKISGIDCARAIQDKNPKTVLVFATGHEQYMKSAFEVYAFDYLVKPFRIERALNTLRLIRERLRETCEGNVQISRPRPKDAPARLMLKNRDGLSFVDIDDILLIQREDRQTVIYAGNEQRFVTGEVLLEQDREIIAAMFGKPVVVEYGSRDGGFTAMACPSGQLHIADENLIIELLDPAGQQVAPGEIGEITLTHLDAFAMPLVRYRIGDLARLADPGTSCPCGRAHAVLTEVHGRVTDHIVCRQGSTVRRMHALSLIYVLREAEGLAQFRVTQPSMDRLDVEVVPDARFTTRQEQLVENRLRQRMGDNVTIRIHRRDHIPPTASGKHACVVSKVVENDE